MTRWLPDYHHCETKGSSAPRLGAQLVVVCQAFVLFEYFHNSLTHSLPACLPAYHLAYVRVACGRSTTCLLVALANGDIRLYGAENNLLHTLKTMEPIAALRFGPYAREDGALAVISSSGTVCAYLCLCAEVVKPSVLCRCF